MSKKLSPLEQFINCELLDASINEKLPLEQWEQLCETLFQFKDAFASADKPLGAIIGHEFHIELKTERPYPPLL